MTGELALYSIDYGWAGNDVVIATSATEAAKIIISKGNNRRDFPLTDKGINNLANSLKKDDIVNGFILSCYGDQ